MKILILPILSLIMSALYYTPWILGGTLANLGPYLLAFFWFLAAWIVAIIYVVKAFNVRNENPSLKKLYWLGLAMILASYTIVWIGIFNGYMVTV